LNSETAYSFHFKIPVREISLICGISPQAIHKYLSSREIKSLLIGNRSYITSDMTHDVLTMRGYQYPKKIISMQMLKGGVGKTTSTLNIAIRANMYGARVLLVDLDQQAHLSFAFGVQDENALVWIDILEGKAPIQKVLRPISKNFDLIPSNLNNSVLEKVLTSGKMNIAKAVSQHLEPILDHYDLIIFDTAPNFSAINTAAACASNLIILPIKPDKFALDGLQKSIRELTSIQKEFDAHFTYQILYTGFDSRETISHDTLRHLITHHGDRMFKGFIRSTSLLKTAIYKGQTIFTKQSSAKEDYDQVTRELLGLDILNMRDTKVANANN
jgi:chromosome partitioning protein